MASGNFLNFCLVAQYFTQSLTIKLAHTYNVLIVLLEYIEEIFYIDCSII